MKKKLVMILLSQILTSAFSNESAVEEGLESLMFLEIPEIITSTLLSQSYNKVPGTMTVITEKEIQVYGLQNLYEVFNIIPGFQNIMSQNNQWMPIIRGYQPGANSHLKILIDSHPVNEAVYRGNLAWADFPLTDVKQIEVMRGPGSAIYGTDAFSGVMNIITKKTKRTKIEATAGEFDHKREHFTHYDKVNDFSYGISIDYLEEDGPDLTYSKGFFTKTPFAVEPVTYERTKKRTGVMLDTRYKNLSFVFNHAENEQLWTEGTGNILTDSAPENPSKYTYAEMNYKHTFSNDSYMQLSFGYDLNKIIYDGKIFPNRFSMGRDINGDGVIESWPIGAFMKLEAKAESYEIDILFNKEWETHNLTLGFQVGRDKILDVYSKGNFHPFYRYKVPEETVWKDDKDQWINGKGEEEKLYAPYFQDIFTVSDTLTLILGARYDDYSKAGSTFSPRMGVVWEAFEETKIKFSYGKAFFAPWAMARYANVLTWIGNPDIDPQTIHTYEISLQNLYEKKFHYKITLFQSEIENRILLDLNKFPSYNNEGDANVKGVELEARWTIEEFFGLWANYSYADTRDKDLDTDLALSIEHMGNVGIFYSLLKNKIKGSIYAHISGDQMHQGDIPGGTEKTDGWITVNANVVFNCFNNFELSFIANNLLDEEYYYPNNKVSFIETGHGSDFPANPRQLFLKAKYSF